jgi:heterodisulfide reductase subunit C
MTVQLITEKGTEKGNPAFAKEVMERSQAHLEKCYQCIACSSGCPGAYQMDYPPHQLLRMVQLGMKEQVLNSNSFWICLSCETCATRCPNGVEIVRVMDVLREMALVESRKGTTKLPVFHNTFLGMIKSFGKAYEIGLILVFMIRSGNIFKLKDLITRDAPLGIKMFMLGKLAILPPKIQGKAQIKRIFELSSKTG